jgi:hypothetical protein
MSYAYPHILLFAFAWFIYVSVLGGRYKLRYSSVCNFSGILLHSVFWFRKLSASVYSWKKILKDVEGEVWIKKWKKPWIIFFGTLTSKYRTLLKYKLSNCLFRIFFSRFLRIDTKVDYSFIDAFTSKTWLTFWEDIQRQLITSVLCLL